MRLRVEFTTEPFDLDQRPAHALVAQEVVREADRGRVDVGPFGDTVEGRPEAVLATVDTLVRGSLKAGATRVSVRADVVGEGEA
ncbi:hypothetical protein [Streptomyces sp. NPDC057702]|uniref:hypothetical protein n=1 Tax=unclassified Streptomyces TaxID=2593676 RepID=UPI0036C5B04D